jgi:hypothetical protein
VCVNKESEKGVWAPVLHEHVGGSPSLCVCWPGGRQHSRFQLLETRWHRGHAAPLQIRSRGQRKASGKFKVLQRMQPASRQASWQQNPRNCHGSQHGSLQRTKTERNYKNDQNEAVHKVFQTRQSCQCLADLTSPASRREAVLQAFKVESFLNLPVCAVVWETAGMEKPLSHTGRSWALNMSQIHYLHGWLETPHVLLGRASPQERWY